MPGLKRVCLLTDENLYDTMRYFSSKLEKAFNSKGVETMSVDAALLTPYEASSILNFKPDLTLSFHNFEPDSQGKFLWDYLKLPHLTISVDPPIYRKNLTSSPYSMIACMDENDVQWLKDEGFKRTFMLPHASGAEAIDPENNRPIDVLFLGSCYDAEGAKKDWEEKASPEVQNKIREIIQLAQKNQGLSFVSAIQNIYPEGLHDKEFVWWIDNYLRGSERTRLLKGIRDIKVDLYGDLGWKRGYSRPWNEVLGKQKNIVIHPFVSLEESVKLMGQSKITLNSMPFFRRGSHERLFMGLAAGSFLVTNYSSWVAEHFQPGEGIVFFDLENINRQLIELLKDDEKRIREVKKGQEKVLKEHTWNERADYLIKILPPLLKEMIR